MAVKEQKKSKIKMHKKMKEIPVVKGQKDENRDLESGDNPDERSKGMKSSSEADEE